MSNEDLRKFLGEQTQELKKFTADQFKTYSQELKHDSEKRFRSHSKELRDDYARQGKFLLDEFKSQASIVAEQYTGLRKGFIDLRGDFKDLKNDFNSLNQKVDGIAEMVARNTEDIAIIKQDTGFIKGSLKRKVDIEEFTALEKRVLILERKA